MAAHHRRLAALAVAPQVGLDVQAAALEHDTRTITGTELPPVLTAETVGERALSWPPLRAALGDLVRRWELLAERAPDDLRRTRAGQVHSLLQELLAAVDAENQALAAGRDWRLLRPQVDQLGIEDRHGWILPARPAQGMRTTQRSTTCR